MSSTSSEDEGAQIMPPAQPEPQQAPNPRPKRKSPEAEAADRPPKRRRRYSEAIQFLSEQVSGIMDVLSGNYHNFQPIAQSSPYSEGLDAEVSRELYSEPEAGPSTSGMTRARAEPSRFELPINTVLKEPTMPKTSEDLLKTLQHVQHFDSENWSNVRYVDVQKHYCSYPGYTDLETNDELKPYDKYNNLSLCERGFAAITQALVKQNQAAQSGFEALVSWSKTAELSPQSIQEKISELFVQGDFQKISSDALQIACGHRADLIQQRRDSILRSVKDKYLKATIRKIPPSNECLFKKDSLSAVIDKNGGVAKIMWPLRAPTQNKPATQAGGSSQPNLTFKGLAQSPYDFSRAQQVDRHRPFLAQFSSAVPSFPAQGNYRPQRPSALQNKRPRGNRGQTQDGQSYPSGSRTQGKSNVPRRGYQPKGRF